MSRANDSLRLELLGPVRVWRDGAEVDLGPPKQRAVLGFLASGVGNAVSVEQIVDAVWGSEAPHTAAGGVHTYIAGLRRALEPGRGRRQSGDVVASVPTGYALRLDPRAVDVRVFEDLVGRARRHAAAGERTEAIALFDAALRLWRSEAYTGVPGPFAVVESTRLRELRLTAAEDWAEAMLAAGRHTEAAAVLSEMVSREPLRERLRGLLMLTLYRCGRQAQALALYRETRRLLAAELGVEPAPHLRRLHHRMLNGDPALQPPTREAGPAAPSAPGDGPRPAPLPRPAQLPPAARGFVGRVAELARVRALLAQGRRAGDTAPALVVVDGPPGVGKSALALHLAHSLAGEYPDGQFHVDFAGTDTGGWRLSVEEATALLLRSLGVAERDLPADLPGRTALYRSLVYDKRILVVLDDVADARQVRPLVPNGPGCVLVTGRSRLSGLVARDGAHRVGLAPLRPRESLELFARLLGEARLDGQWSEAARLAHLCGHLPLALRIAAGTLTGEPGMRIDRLVEAYAVEHERLDHLAVPGDATANVRAALASSYRALPPAAARMFRLLGLYGGRIVTAATAARLYDTDRAGAARILQALTDARLLEEDGPHRYRLHVLIGIYAAECAREEPHEDRASALERLSEYWRFPLTGLARQEALCGACPSGA
ncbi:hypothetical protein GCM10027168_67730 [Streptomyces capparidis]